MADEQDRAIALLQKWLDDTPRYEGDDPRAVHYRANRSALETAIAALQPRPVGEVTEAMIAAFSAAYSKAAANWESDTRGRPVPREVLIRAGLEALAMHQASVPDAKSRGIATTARTKRPPLVRIIIERKANEYR